MSRNGSGTYQLPAGNPVVPSTVISSTWANTTLSDIGTALTQSIANDGQTTPVANLPMATFRHTNVGNAVARNDYAAAGQVQDSSLQFLTSVAGTDTITASVTPSPTAYVAGQTFRFVAAGANTTASVTLNINGLGAKAVTKLGIGSLQSGMVVEVVYDGTQFQPISAPSGALIGVQVFSASGTYTPTAGTRSIIAEGVGGGGGGGGCQNNGVGAASGGQGGAGGSYGKGRYTSAFSGLAVTIGAAGTAGTGGASPTSGGNGGTTSLGAILSIPGGTGGKSGASTSSFPAVGQSATAAGAAPTGANITGRSGGFGTSSLLFQSGNGASVSGSGGASEFGEGGLFTTVQAAGNVGSGNGAGGGGGLAATAGTGQAGGAGTAGILIIYEYA